MYNMENKFDGKLRLVSSKEREDKSIYVYEGLGYEVKIFYYEDKLYKVSIVPMASKSYTHANYYLPEIYPREFLADGKIEGFDIQTCSYGALDLDKTEAMINSLQCGVDLVKLLEEKILKEGEQW